MRVFAARYPLVPQRHALVNAEAVLFVDNDQRQPLERDALLE
jgi:hypothetical protein